MVPGLVVASTRYEGRLGNDLGGGLLAQGRIVFACLMAVNLMKEIVNLYLYWHVRPPPFEWSTTRNVVKSSLLPKNRGVVKMNKVLGFGTRSLEKKKTYFLQQMIRIRDTDWGRPTLIMFTSWQATQYFCPCLSWSSMVEQAGHTVASILYPFTQPCY